MKIKEFLVMLEKDQALLDRYRTTKQKPARKRIAMDKGLSDTQAEVLQSKSIQEIKKAIEDEDGGGTVFCVVMAD